MMSMGSYQPAVHSPTCTTSFLQLCIKQFPWGLEAENIPSSGDEAFGLRPVLWTTAKAKPSFPLNATTLAGQNPPARSFAESAQNACGL
jgi:hypothetical protein